MTGGLLALVRDLAVEAATDPDILWPTVMIVGVVGFAAFYAGYVGWCLEAWPCL